MEHLKNIVNIMKQIRSREPENLIHNPGPDYSAITLAVSLRGMKLSAVAFDRDDLPVPLGGGMEHEIKSKTSTVGITIYLPPETIARINNFAEIPDEIVLDRSVAGAWWDKIVTSWRGVRITSKLTRT